MAGIISTSVVEKTTATSALPLKGRQCKSTEDIQAFLVVLWDSSDSDPVDS